MTQTWSRVGLGVRKRLILPTALFIVSLPFAGNGGKVDARLGGSTLHLNWSDIFAWKGTGHLVYVIYVGTEEGSANMVTGERLES